MSVAITICNLMQFTCYSWLLIIVPRFFHACGVDLHAAKALLNLMRSFQAQVENELCNEFSVSIFWEFFGTKRLDKWLATHLALALLHLHFAVVLFQENLRLSTGHFCGIHQIKPNVSHPKPHQTTNKTTKSTQKANKKHLFHLGTQTPLGLPSRLPPPRRRPRPRPWQWSERGRRLCRPTARCTVGVSWPLPNAPLPPSENVTGELMSKWHEKEWKNQKW